MTDNNIEQRILALGNYFRGMQVSIDDNNNKLVIVTVKFPENWIIADDISSKFGVTVMKGEKTEYYFAIEISNGFGKVFDAIEYNIEKMKRALERADLLKKKASELQNLFADESIPLEKLRTLNFGYNTTVISLPTETMEVNVPANDLIINDPNVLTPNKEPITAGNAAIYNTPSSFPLSNDPNVMPSPMDERNEPIPEEIPNKKKRK